MSFRYYITDLNEGAVLGTDNIEVANDLAASEDHFVVDTANGEWVTADGPTKVEEGYL